LFLALAGWQAIAAPDVAPEELESAIAAGLPRVAEFEYIRAEAQRLGVRVWLFGGTAAAFGHYVNWDLRRQKGDTRYAPELFNYDFPNIFRRTQDLDLVVDGPMEKIEELERLIVEKFPYTQGDRASAWELRPLNASRGRKEALLGNPDFLNQHTDSNSTGLIQLTDPIESDRRIRDFRDWDARWPKFFEDVRRGELHYYFSDKHETTARFKNGTNPPIISVVRYLTKAFQYELAIAPEDRAVIQKIVDDFDPRTDLENHVARDWMERNGKKLFRHAANVEYAWRVLKELGLKKKLAQLADPNESGSLAWWMKKKPLKSFPVGKGKGATAAELKVDIVSHEAGDYSAFESILRSPKGEPNVFISRDRRAGETARYGNGFYTRMGRYGARDTGYTIRFKMNPAAREGSDFLKAGDYIVILNRGAIVVDTQDATLTPVRFFALLDKLDRGDAGLVERFLRNSVAKMRALGQAERDAIVDHLASHLNQMPAWHVYPYLNRALELIGHAPLSVDELTAFAAKVHAKDEPFKALAHQTLPNVIGADNLLKLFFLAPELIDDEGLDRFAAARPEFAQVLTLYEFVRSRLDGEGKWALLRKIVERIPPKVGPDIVDWNRWIRDRTDEHAGRAFVAGCKAGFAFFAKRIAVKVLAGAGVTYGVYKAWQWYKEANALPPAKIDKDIYYDNWNGFRESKKSEEKKEPTMAEQRQLVLAAMAPEAREAYDWFTLSEEYGGLAAHHERALTLVHDVHTRAALDRMKKAYALMHKREEDGGLGVSYYSAINDAIQAAMSEREDYLDNYAFNFRFAKDELKIDDIDHRRNAAARMTEKGFPKNPEGYAEAFTRAEKELGFPKISALAFAEKYQDTPDIEDTVAHMKPFVEAVGKYGVFYENALAFAEKRQGVKRRKHWVDKFHAAFAHLEDLNRKHDSAHETTEWLVDQAAKLADRADFLPYLGRHAAAFRYVDSLGPYAAIRKKLERTAELAEAPDTLALIARHREFYQRAMKSTAEGGLGMGDGDAWLWATYRAKRDDDDDD
jgi:hypothetical protein